MLRISLFAAFGLLAVLLLAFSRDRAEAVGFVSISQTGPAVDAFWELENADGTVTFVNVFAGEQRYVFGRPPPQTHHQVFVDIATIDFGDPDDPFDDSGRFISGFGELSPGRLDVDLAHQSATLNLALAATECTFLPDAPPSDCDETTITVNLDWAAVSDSLKLNDKFHENAAHCRIRAHFKGNLTPAEASGSISAGGADYTRGEPSAFGEIIESTRDQLVFIAASQEDCFGEPLP